MPAVVLQMMVFYGGLALSSLDAHAGSCVGAGAPYTIGAQNDTIELDADCAAAGGVVTVSGNVTGDDLGSGQAVIHDQPGNEQDWAVTINAGVTVQDIVNATAGVRFESANGSLDNSGMVNVTQEAVLFSGVTGSVINRAGAVLTSTGGGGVTLLSGGVVNNAGMISAPVGSTGITLEQSGTIENSGSISGGRGVLFANFANDGMADIVTLTNTTSGTITATNAGADGVMVTSNEGGSATITNHGTISGGANNAGIRFNSFNGPTGTIVNSGTINGGALGAIVFNDLTATNDVLELQPGFAINGNVLGNGGTDILRLGGTGNGTFDLGTIDTGANTLQYRSFETFQIVSGAWALTGATTVPFTQNGGTVSGNATFGNFTVNGGTVAPGNSIGTITVNGDFSLNAGSTLVVEVSPTAADQVIATGNVTINAGATLNIVELPGSSFTGVAPLTFVIIDKQSAGAVTGNFGTLTNSLAFSTATVTTTGGDGNDVAIIVTPIVAALVNPTGTTPTTATTVTFAGVAQTRNQFSVASALDNGLFAGGIANTDEQEVATSLLGLTAGSARRAYDLMSGEIHPAISNALLGVALDLSNALSQRGASSRVLNQGNAAPLGFAALTGSAADVAQMGLNFWPKPKSDLQGISRGEPNQDRDALNLQTWATGIGRISKIEATTGAGGVDQSNYGFVGGVDINVWKGLRAGIAASYSHLDVTVGSRASEADVESGSVSAYASYFDQAFHLLGSATYSYGFVDTERTISFGGLTRTADADYNAHQVMLYSEGGYTHTFGPALLQPVLAARYTYLNRESFSETGAGSLNLIASSESDNRFDLIAGLRLSSTHAFNGMKLVPQANAFFTHSFGEVQGDADFAFSGGGTVNRVVSSSRGREALSVGLGASLIASDRVSGFLDYQATVSRHAVDNSFKGGLTVKF